MDGTRCGQSFGQFGALGAAGDRGSRLLDHRLTRWFYPGRADLDQVESTWPAVNCFTRSTSVIG